MDIEIKALTKYLTADYLHLFDNMIHKENPDWSKCYCNHFHFLGDVDSCTRENSREMIINRINENELQGYLVYNKERAIGWCNVNNKLNYQRLLRDYGPNDITDDKVCSVVCFLIHPDYRRNGISQKILEKVISDYSNKEYDYIESYPRIGDTSVSNFNGHVELYNKNNFKIYKEYDSYYVMRKKITRLNIDNNAKNV